MVHQCKTACTAGQQHSGAQREYDNDRAVHVVTVEECDPDPEAAPMYPWQQAFGHGARIFGLAFHPACSDMIASASEDETVRVWRRESSTGAWQQVFELDVILRYYYCRMWNSASRTAYHHVL